jgi:hypothetical protein
MRALPECGVWVHISEIPEDWKDGRTVDLTVKYNDESGGFRLTDCYFRDGKFRGPDYDLYEYGVYVTHAMLPPNPPEMNTLPRVLPENIPNLISRAETP